MGILTQRAQRTQREGGRGREGGREGGYLGLDAGEEEVRKASWAIVFPVEGLTSWGCRRCKSGVKPPHSKLLLSGE